MCVRAYVCVAISDWWFQDNKVNEEQFVDFVFVFFWNFGTHFNDYECKRFAEKGKKLKKRVKILAASLNLMMFTVERYVYRNVEHFNDFIWAA